MRAISQIIAHPNYAKMSYDSASILFPKFEYLTAVGRRGGRQTAARTSKRLLLRPFGLRNGLRQQGTWLFYVRDGTTKVVP